MPPQRMIFTVQIDGKEYDIEGERPPTEAEARAAIGLSAPASQGRRASAKTGGAATANDSPDIAPDWGAVLSHMGQSAVDTLNPAMYYRAGKELLTTNPLTSAQRIMAGVRDTAGNLVNGNFSATVGDLSGPAVVGGVVSGGAKMARASATPLMEAGLQRPRSAQVDFPNAASRLVNERIMPRMGTVQSELDRTERSINTATNAFDRNLAGMDPSGVPTHMRLALPPAQGRVMLPPGDTLTARPIGQSPSAPSVWMTDPNRVLRTAGPAGDAARGPVVMNPSARTPPMRGANPGQVDPFKIADEARAFASREGKLKGLGDTPGPELANLDAAAQDYLAKNTRPRSVTETVEQKRSLQARARYNNRANAPTQTNESALFDKGAADANRRAAIERVPSLEGDLAREQDLLGALIALESRAKPGPAFNMTSAVRRTLMNPTLMGGAAIGLDVAGNAAQRITPAMVRAAWARLMASHQSENAK